MTSEDLKQYVELVISECGCVDVEEVGESLGARYGWECNTRMDALAAAWQSVHGTQALPAPQAQSQSQSQLSQPTTSPKSPKSKKSSPKKPTPGEGLSVPVAVAPRPAQKRVIRLDDDEEEEQEERGKGVDEEKTKVDGDRRAIEPPLGGGNRIPILIKGTATTGAGRNLLLCQVDDAELSFQGDSGAVGRFSVTATGLDLDIKGRQYQGTLLPGPTVLLLNLAKPVGAQAGYKPVARVEAITNEFCHLEFSKDLLGGLMGAYSGEEGFQIESDGEVEGPTKEGGKKRGGGAGGGKNKRANAMSDSESRGSDADSDDSSDEKPRKKSKVVKISTVTSRRANNTKKKGTKTKTKKAKAKSK